MCIFLLVYYNGEKKPKNPDQECYQGTEKNAGKMLQKKKKEHSLPEHSSREEYIKKNKYIHQNKSGCVNVSDHRGMRCCLIRTRLQIEAADMLSAPDHAHLRFREDQVAPVSGQQYAGSV